MSKTFHDGKNNIYIKYPWNIKIQIIIFVTMISSCIINASLPILIRPMTEEDILQIKHFKIVLNYVT